MSGVRVTADGRVLLIGARGFLLLTPGQVGEPADPGPGSGTTSLALADYITSQQGGVVVEQRRAGTDVATIQVAGTFAGAAPLSVQYRIVRAVGGAVVRDWTTLSNMVIDTDGFIGNAIDVPLGGAYLLQIRDGMQPSNPATTSNGTKPWGVGVRILSFGQSNNIGTFDAGSYLDIVPGQSVSEYAYSKQPGRVASYFGTNGTTTADGSSGSSLRTIGGGSLRFLRITAAALKAKYGFDVPVALIPWAFNSQSLASFLLPNGANTAIFKNNGSAAGAIGMASPARLAAGDFEGATMHQLEADSAQTRAQRLAVLQATVLQMLDLVAPYGRTAENFFFRPAVGGVYTGVNGVEKMRGAIHDLEAYAREGNRWPRVRAGWDCIDLDPADGGDGLHFVDVAGGKQYRKMSFSRMQQSVLYELGCAPVDGMGPKLTGAYTRSSNVVTLEVAQNGGTALVAGSGPITGWLANPAVDFSGADVQPASVDIVGPEHIAVTFPEGTVFPLNLKHCGGLIGAVNSRHPDVTNLIYDDVSYPTGTIGTDVQYGRPLQPTPDALTIF